MDRTGNERGAAFSPRWMSARGMADSRQAVFAVLPAFLLCVALRVTVARLRGQDRTAPGGPGLVERFGLDWFGLDKFAIVAAQPRGMKHQ